VTVVESAPCKVNLYLDVLGRRADGYHGIESVMTTLPLCDTVAVCKTDKGIRVKFRSGERLSDDLESLPEEKNLAYAAAKLFFEKAGINDSGIDITIDKKIPSRAGLGGGSADAAAVLRAMNKIYSYPFETDELCRFALSLGADVPFCVAGGAALCRGVGEIMTKIDNRLEFHGIITSEAAEKKSTAEAYRAIDTAKCSLVPAQNSAVKMAAALEEGDFETVCREAYNVFGEVCGYPDDVRKYLRALGAPFVLMSGAGPSVIALVERKSDADILYEKVVEYGCKAYSF